LIVRIVLHWILTAVAFVVTAAVAFIPMLFLLAATPLHDGSDSPGPVLLYSTFPLTVIIAVTAAWLVGALFRSRQENGNHCGWPSGA